MMTLAMILLAMILMTTILGETMKTTMILGGHTAVICVRNARCWDVTVEEGGVDEVTHRIAHNMCLTALLLPFCTHVAHS